MCLPHHDVELAHLFAIVGAELTVLDPIGVCLLVFIPQKLQSNGFLAFELSVNLFPFRHRPGPELARVARIEQLFHLFATAFNHPPKNILFTGVR
jgi:hypothetical protein